MTLPLPTLRTTAEPLAPPMAMHRPVAAPWLPDLLFAAVLSLAVLVVLGAPPVPAENEFQYLLAPFRQWHPEYLPSDWTLQSGSREHLLFNALVGLPMLAVSVEAVGWVGRFAVWIALLLGLVRLGRRIGLSPVFTAVPVLLWIATDQSPVAFEWVFGGFEAKCVAYAFVLFGLDRLIAERDAVGGALLGLGASFHPPVGLIVAVSVGCAMLLLRWPWARIGRVVLWTFLGALPGIIAAVGSGSSMSVDDWRYVALVQMPFHMDPLSFPARDTLLLVTMAAFVFVRAVRRDAPPASRFLAAFLAGSFVVFGLGVAARVVGAYPFMQLTPFRVAVLFTPLFFLLEVVRSYRAGEIGRMHPAVVLLGLLTLMGSRNPLGRTVDHVRRSVALRTAPDPIADGMRWIDANVPQDALVVLPPWRKDTYYLARRPQIANWTRIRIDRLGEWRERMGALLGTLPSRPEEATEEALERRYAALTQPQVSQLATRYGATYMLSRGDYDLPILHREGDYKVYRLQADSAVR